MIYSCRIRDKKKSKMLSILKKVDILVLICLYTFIRINIKDAKVFHVLSGPEFYIFNMIKIAHKILGQCAAQ